ncbi:MAG: OB-fold domain-containing protein, partial [Steroidobacteraceae bacterium]|nr:OB-fold domain-containing protein [Steroidobacteraceae bacterium]MDW8258704.1 OB-fold domain-containing protein [Gammaproteobacteria bacterium]
SGNAALPRLRLSRATIAAATSWVNPTINDGAHGARAVCNWDEDAVTLAVEAARHCVADALRFGSTPQALRIASTTLPFADRDHGALIATALDLPATTATREYAGSLRAGVGALVDAAMQGRCDVVIASDVRPVKPAGPLELKLGAGAAALLIASPPMSDRALALVRGAGRVSADFVDHYRGKSALTDYVLEERWVRDEGWLRFPQQACAAALADAGIAAEQVRHLVLPGAEGIVRKIAGQIGCPAAQLADNLHGDCGDTGAAHPLLMLLAHLPKTRPGDWILLGGFAQGCEAVVLQAGDAVRSMPDVATRALARRTDENNYLRYLSHAGLIDIDFGMRAERDQRTAHSVAWRKHRAVTAFVGGRCDHCGTVQYPASRACVAPHCRRIGTQREYRLAESSGRVKTFTEDWQAFSPRPPYVYGNIEFAEGGNLLMELTDIGPGELAVGDRVRFVFRIKDIDRQRGFRRYCWKAVKD